MIGCNLSRELQPAPADRLVTFYTILESRDEQVIISLGINNSGTRPLPADDSFGGTWELAGPSGAKRAGGWIGSLAALPGDGEEKILGQWSGELEPGTYILTWGAPTYGSTADRFEVQVEAGQVRIGQHESHMSPQYPPDRRYR
jgi:hypothetical protein